PTQRSGCPSQPPSAPLCEENGTCAGWFPVTPCKAFAWRLGHDLSRRFAKASRVPRRKPMTITVAHITPILALVGGIVILIAPRILAYIVAVWLIIYGVLGIWPNLLG